MKVLQQLFASFFIIFYAVTTAVLPVTAFAQGQGAATALIAAPTSGTAPLTVSFNGRIYKGNGTLNYGDGSSATIAFPSTLAANEVYTFPARLHTYRSPGTYTAVLTDPDTTARATIVVASPGARPTCFITVNPSSISVGGSVTVTWQSINATAGAITNIGNVGPNGSINLLPSSNSITTYFGAFTGPGGTTNCQASVAVNSTSNGSSNNGLNSVPPADLTNTAVTNTPTALGVAPVASQGSSGLVPCGYGSFTGNSGRDPGASTGCQACDLATLIQNIINFAIGIAIPIAAALMAYAGVLYFTSAAKPGNIEKAKGIFKDALLGFLIAITAWLVINTLLHIIFNQNASASGNWFTIQCAAQPRPVNNKIADVLSQLPIIAGNTGAIQPDGSGVNASGNPSGGGAGGTTPGSTADGSCNSGYSLQIYEDGSAVCVDSTGTNIQNPTCASGSTLNSNNQCFVDYTSTGPGVTCPSGSFYLPEGGTCSDANGNLVEPLPVAVGAGNGGNIAAAALAYQGSNTSAGPDGGNLACAWAVNNVLALSGIPPIDGNSVDQMETVLENGRGTEVTPATAQAGDIVIENNDTMSHVGICFDPTGGTGCPQVLSNSSSKATFSNISDITMGTGIAPTIYRVNK